MLPKAAYAESMTPAALKHLSAIDPVMRRLIRDFGPCELAPETRRSPFQSLVQAVAHQQLHGAAANTILAPIQKTVSRPPVSRGRKIWHR